MKDEEAVNKLAKGVGLLFGIGALMLLEVLDDKPKPKPFRDVAAPKMKITEDGRQYATAEEIEAMREPEPDIMPTPKEKADLSFDAWELERLKQWYIYSHDEGRPVSVDDSNLYTKIRTALLTELGKESKI